MDFYIVRKNLRMAFMRGKKSSFIWWVLMNPTSSVFMCCQYQIAVCQILIYV